MSEFYTGKNDVVFKTIICNEEDPRMIIWFLSRLLKTPVTKIKFKNKERGKRYIGEHGKTVDFLAEVNGEMVHIELNSSVPNYLYVRNFAYFTEVYSKFTKSGKKYTDEVKFIHIDLTYGLQDEYDYTTYTVQNPDGLKYIENLTIIEYNMSKLMKYWYEKNLDKIEEYKFLIMLDLKHEDLSNISKGDDFMLDYEKQLNNLNNDDEFKSLMTPEEDYQKILNTERYLGKKEGLEQGLEQGHAEGLEQGLEQGHAEGLEQGKVEIIKNMLDSNMTIEEISTITKISIEDINRLLNK